MIGKAGPLADRVSCLSLAFLFIMTAGPGTEIPSASSPVMGAAGAAMATSSSNTTMTSSSSPPSLATSIGEEYHNLTAQKARGEERVSPD